MGQNAITNLMGNRAAIQRLMQMDREGELTQRVNEANESGRLSVDDSGELNYSGNYTAQNEGYERIPKINTALSQSKLPKAILESFKKNPPVMDETGISTTSVLDKFLPRETIQKLDEEVTKKNTAPITENHKNTYANTNSGIDYSLLKTIINESVEANVKKYVGGYLKKTLNESKESINNLAAVKIGNDDITFITEGGDVYKAKLTYIKNMRDNTRKS